MAWIGFHFKNTFLEAPDRAIIESSYHLMPQRRKKWMLQVANTGEQAQQTDALSTAPRPLGPVGDKTWFISMFDHKEAFSEKKTQ